MPPKTNPVKTTQPKSALDQGMQACGMVKGSIAYAHVHHSLDQKSGSAVVPTPKQVNDALKLHNKWAR